MADGVRPVAPVEVEPRISNEVRLVFEAASRIYAAHPGLLPEHAIHAACELLDQSIAACERRLEDRMKAEARRRRGY